MSDAKASSTDIFSISVCSQCQQSFFASEARDARHAIPCGHVFCKGCLVRVEAEQKSGKSLCRRAGCERELGRVCEFGPSWVAERAQRIYTELAAVLSDQGNVGDRRRGALEVEAEGAPSLCAEHKLPFKAIESSSKRPLCSECLPAMEAKVVLQTFDEAFVDLDRSDDSVSAELVRQMIKLVEPTFTPEEFCDRLNKWTAEETGRITAWEEREVKLVQAVAAETLQLVKEVCARKIEMGASLLTQRMGLRASLEELDRALGDLPKDLASRLSKASAVYADRKRLRDLLAAGGIAVPSARAVLQWAELPALSAEFGGKAAGEGGVLANAASTAAKATLGWALQRTPGIPEFPVMPNLVR